MKFQNSNQLTSFWKYMGINLNEEQFTTNIKRNEGHGMNLKDYIEHSIRNVNHEPDEIDYIYFETDDDTFSSTKITDDVLEHLKQIEFENVIDYIEIGLINGSFLELEYESRGMKLRGKIELLKNNTTTDELKQIIVNNMTEASELV